MYICIRSSRPVTASITAHYTGLLKSIIKRRKAGDKMTEKETAINAAIFAVVKMVDKGSTSYAVKDRSGLWHTMAWETVIKILYEIERQVKTNE